MLLYRWHIQMLGGLKASWGTQILTEFKSQKVRYNCPIPDEDIGIRMKIDFAKHLLLAFCRGFYRTEFDGIKISAAGSNTTEADFMTAKVIAALTLIREIDPRRYRYLQRDVKRILVMGAPNYCGTWHNSCALCELTDSYVRDRETTPEMLASTIVHEAMHARLHRWGIGYEEDKRVRVEQICFKASIAFARRLPLSAKVARKAIMSGARRQLVRDPILWTDLGNLDYDLEAFRKEGMPNWIIALLRRWKLAQIRREKYSRTQGK